MKQALVFGAVFLAATAVTLHAQARGCSEQSGSRAVGLASCHRFGDWETGSWAPSFATGFVFRTIPLPNDLGVCARFGKSCTDAGTLQTVRPDTQHAFTGIIDVTALSLGPLRFGVELGVGGTDGGTLGRYGTTTVRTGGFMFGSAAFSGGLAFSFGRFALRAEGLAGVAGLTTDVGLTTADGKSLSADYTYAQLEGRGSISYWITPWVSVGAMGGYGVGEIWHAGLVLRFALAPWDGTHH
jgi:hypothetical protein